MRRLCRDVAQPDISAATPEQVRVLEAYISAGSSKAAARELGLSNQQVRHRLAAL